MSSVRRNILYNTFLKVANIVTPIVTIPYVTRILVPEDLGLYNFAVSYTSIFILISTLGLANYGPREIAKVRDDRKKTNLLLNELYSVSIVSSIIISILFVLSILIFEKIRSDASLFLLAGVSLYLRPLQIDWFYCGLEDFKFITIRNIFINVVSIILIFIFVKSKSDLLIYVLLQVTSNVISYFWNFIMLYKKGYQIKFTISRFFFHLKPLLILLSSAIAIYIYTTIDTIMLGFLTSYSEVAFYTYPMHILRGLLLIVTSLSGVVIPRVSYYNGYGDKCKIIELINKTFSFVTYLSVPICISVFMLSSVFVPLFLGLGFSGSIPILQILSFLVVIIGWNNVLAIQCLVSLGYDKYYFYCLLGGCISNIMLNILMIPHYGAIGASISSVIAEFLVFISSLYYVNRKTYIKIDYKKDSLSTFLGSSLLIPLYLILSYFFSDLSLLFLFVLLGFLLYFITQYKLSNKTALLMIKIFKNKTIR